MRAGRLLRDLQRDAEAGVRCEPRDKIDVIREAIEQADGAEPVTTWLREMLAEEQASREAVSS